MFHPVAQYVGCVYCVVCEIQPGVGWIVGAASVAIIFPLPHAKL